ncbi:MAG TPA: SAM-dependent methyltransferase [Thermoanaerobaculia bacterium]|nr:SAM-dependent methyltransferase [Thermoanaerobaculia bacterium]
MRDVLRNMLQYGDLPFRDFVEVVLYHPEFGYYTRAKSPVGKEGDFITGPSLSPAFSFAIGKLVRDFVSRHTDEVSTIVDIGCGGRELVRALKGIEGAEVFGVERIVTPSVSEGPGGAGGHNPVPPRPLAHARGDIVASIFDLPRNGAQLIISNELFDALPFARLVRRGSELHELTVTKDFDWGERQADPRYIDYFAERGIELEDGQFADVSLEWEAMYAELCRFVERGLIVTFDYGYPGDQLFRSRMRRYGTAAAYRGHRVSRDLLADPGEQDLTAHINFTDLQREGERQGFETIAFTRQAQFLLSLGIAEHELFTPIHDLERASIELMEQRDEARRLVLPDGIGEEIRVLLQAKGVSLQWRPVF